MKSKKLTGLITVLAFFLGMGSVSAQAEEMYQNQKDEVVMLVNEQRNANGLKSLYESEFLNQVAQVRAEEITQKFSHERPDGRICFTAFTDKGKNYWYIGENIASGMPTEESVVNAWMNSEHHRENILSKNFGAIGIGVVLYSGSYYWVQIFTDGEGLEPLYSIGNINRDGEINAKDASLVLTNSALEGAGNAGIMNRMQKSFGDMNRDKIINAKDASIILSYSAYVGAGGTDSIEVYLK